MPKILINQSPLTNGAGWRCPWPGCCSCWYCCGDSITWVSVPFSLTYCGTWTGTGIGGGGRFWDTICTVAGPANMPKRQSGETNYLKCLNKRQYADVSSGYSTQHPRVCVRVCVSFLICGGFGGDKLGQAGDSWRQRGDS